MPTVAEEADPRQALTARVVGAARRLSWGLADQAVSSLTNFAVGIAAAKSLSVTEFGAFSLVYVTYGVAVNMSRGLATDPLMVRFSGADTASWRTAVAKAAGTATSVGVLFGMLCVGAGLALHGTTGLTFVALGVVLPGLLLQDSWRYAFFAAATGRKAFANDVVWAIALVPALVLASSASSAPTFVLAWGGAAAAAAVAGGVQARLAPRPLRTRQWLTQQRELSSRYLVENVSLGGAAQLRMYALGAIAGLADVGTVRGAELMLGPFFVVLMGVGLFAVPEAARVLRRSPEKLWLFTVAIGGGQAMAALLWGTALLLFLPDAVGAKVLGPVWATASALLLPATLSVANASFSTGASSGLRALAAPRRSMRAQLFASVAYLTGGVVGAFTGGALGSSWGCAAATLVAACVWWWQLRAGIRDRLRNQEVTV